MKKCCFAVLAVFTAIMSLAGCVSREEWARLGDASAVLSLLEEGRDINGKINADGDTYLIMAADKGNEQLVKTLLEKGADINRVSDKGHTALTAATTNGHIGLTRLFFEKGATLPDRVGKDTPLIKAAYGANAEMIEFLIAKGADVKAVGENGKTALHAAAIFGNAPAVRALLAHGADPTVEDNDHAKPSDLARVYMQYAKDSRSNEVFAMLTGTSKSGREITGSGKQADRKGELDAKSDKENFEKAKAANTFKAYKEYLKAFPSSSNRAPALKAMAGLIEKRNGVYEDHRKFVGEYEDGLEFVPEKHRLALTGPEGMRVHDIVVLRKKGVEDSLIGAKIDMGRGKYKDYSFEEMDALKKMGVPAVLIKAMLDSTARAKREEEELQKKKAMEEILAEIQRVQNRLEELKTEQSSAITASASPGQDQGPSVGDTVKNCSAQIAALEGCKRLPSLGAMVCTSVAKSQFPCQ